MLGHGQRRRVNSDLRAIELLARYARSIAKVHVLRPSGATFQDFRAVAAPSFCCRLRLVPFDQTSELVEFDAVDSQGCRVKSSVGAAILRLQFWPVRVLVLDLAIGSTDSAPAQWQALSGGSTALNSREAAAASDAFMMRGGEAEPHLTIHLRNRCAVEPLAEERQKGMRQISDLKELKTKGPAFLSVRSIYVGDRSSNDDVKAQFALALMQASIVAEDSIVADWFSGTYLPSFLSRSTRAAGNKMSALVCASALSGLWKNAGDAERAQAWRLYVKSWVSWSERPYFRHGKSHALVDDPDGDDGDERRRDQEIARGAISPARKHKRDAWYATPRDEADEMCEPVSVEEVASKLGVSIRTVYRVVNADRLRPLRRNPTRFDPGDVATLAREWAEKRAAGQARQETIRRLERRSEGTLKPESLRKAEYRSRTRTGTLLRH